MMENLPPLTPLQFYIKCIIIALVGVGYALLMAFVFAWRDKRLGWTELPQIKKLREYAAYALFFIGAAVGYFVVPGLFHAGVNEVSTVVAQGVTDMTMDAIALSRDDDDFSVTPTNRISVTTDDTDTPWLLFGEESPGQNADFLKLLWFFVLLGWAGYLLDYEPSRVGIVKKILKAVGYVAMLIFVLKFPISVHYLSMSDFAVPLLCAAVAAACLWFARATTQLPPPLPGKSSPSPPPLPDSSDRESAKQ